MKKVVGIIFLLLTLSILGKEINIGDSINLKISGVEKEKIVKAFEKENFAIENVKEEAGGVVLTAKGFKVGENSINIGDKNLIINIKSLLTPEDKDIYINLSDESNKELYLHNFPYVTILSSGVGVGAIIFLIMEIKRGKKEKSISPQERFERKIKDLSQERWAFEISYALREFIDSRYSSHFLNGIYEKIGSLDEEDIIFIQWLDNYKFSLERGESMEESREKAFKIYRKIKGGEKDV